MSIARNFTAVVEVVENPKLAGQFVLVGRDFVAVHGERGISITGANVS